MFLLHFPFSMFHTTQRGQAVLSLVLLVGGIVAFVSMTLAFLVASFSQSSMGFVRSNRALATASSGVHDATLRLLRDKDFSATTPYTVTVGDYSASVTVTQASPLPDQVTVLSDAFVSFYERKVRAVFALSSSTGDLQLISWGESL